MKSKAFWLLGLVAIAAMALAACGGAGEPAAPEPAAPSAAATAPPAAAPALGRACGNDSAGFRRARCDGCARAAHARARDTD